MVKGLSADKQFYRISGGSTVNGGGRRKIKEAKPKLQE